MPVERDFLRERINLSAQKADFRGKGEHAVEQDGDDGEKDEVRWRVESEQV